MALSMQHWNGNQVCVIDVETTGLDAHWHEIIQLAILPLDANFDPRKDVMPFNIELIPEHPERIDMKAMTVNKIDLATSLKRGLDREKAKDVLVDWIKTLQLPVGQMGKPKKIIPLGQNYAFDRDFMIRWLGMDWYNELFDYHYKDTMIAANFLNDYAARHADTVPFHHIGLVRLCNILNIEYDRAHDALQDCLACAKVYKAITAKGYYA